MGSIAMMETSTNSSSKPEVTPKKSSNRRVKKKLSSIHENDDDSNHVSVDAKTGNLKKIDSPTHNSTISSTNKNDSGDISMNTSTKLDNSSDTTSEHDENIDPRLIKTIQSPIVEDMKKILDDNQQICVSTVNDRKLFFDCVGGDLDKYKYCVKIESSSLRDVWIGVSNKHSTINFYICTKNSDGSMTSFFMDDNAKHQFESSLVSYIQSNDPNILWKSEGMGQTSFEYTKVNGNLVINQVSYLTKMITFDNDMIYSYWNKKWELERFIVYLQKKRAMLQYCEHIFDNFANYQKTNVTKDDFIYRFDHSNAPNSIFTSLEM